MNRSSSSILAKLKNESIKRDILNQQMITLFLHEEFSRRLRAYNKRKIDFRIQV